MPSNINNNKTQPFYGSVWLVALPLAIMIIPAMILVVYGVVSTNMMITGGVIGIMIGSLFARNKKEYWEVVIKSLGDPTALVAFALFLIVGVYAELLTVVNLGEGIIWLVNQLNTGPTIFILFTYVICSVLGIAMGTSIGVIFILTPILYPVAIATGIPPALAAGAILSGAATGDHFSPVSDTTLVSSMTQHYQYREGTAQVGEVLQDRIKYVTPAFLLACIFYGIAGASVGGIADTSMASIESTLQPKGLIMLLPMLIVIWSAIKNGSVFQALTNGIVSGLLIALLAQLITPEQIFAVKDKAISGILVKGVQSNIDIVMMIVLMMGAYGLMRHYGLLDKMVAKLTNSISNNPRNTELSILGFSSLLSIILIGLTARVTVVAGPVINDLGQQQQLHPCRRANLLDAAANGISYMLPWNAFPMLTILTIKPLLDSFDGLVLPEATALVSMTFYPMLIWCIMLISIFTGYGRRFEMK